MGVRSRDVRDEATQHTKMCGSKYHSKGFFSATKRLEVASVYSTIDQQ